MTEKSDIGVVGLAVMGENLVMNMESKGFVVSVFNRTIDKIKHFVNRRAKDRNIIPAFSLAELARQLKRPRRVMLMVKAGQAVDGIIDELLTILDPGDIIIDGGNSNFTDTARRTEHVETKGLLYIGVGVSGGEEGALKGPSMMPGGSIAAWPEVKSIFQAIAARAPDGSPCCKWVGSGGAGHFVKMVHNGIEYGDMQLVCEAYHLMRNGLGLDVAAMHEAFARWNEGELNSYLVEITRDILAYKDDDGKPLIDKILDAAGQKGTGKWTVISALNEDIALPLIAEAVFSRCLSAAKDERVAAAKILVGPRGTISSECEFFLEDIRQALYASKIVSYAQGFELLRTASSTYGWQLQYGDIALMWREGCIIRSAFLEHIKASFDRDNSLVNLLTAPFFAEKTAAMQDGWRRVTAAGILNGIPMPAIASALSYYDGLRSEKLPVNLLQAQRDYFGAHTYERMDAPRGTFFHTNWTGKGGDTASTVYGG